MSCWCCGSILVSNTRRGLVASSSPFTVMTNIFVTEFKEFRENSNMFVEILISMYKIKTDDYFIVLRRYFFPVVDKGYVSY